MNPEWTFSTEEQDKWLDGPYVIVGSFYLENKTALKEWLDYCTPGWQMKGSVIRFANRYHQTLFKLIWA